MLFEMFGHNPQSIRDQMMRAALLVDRGVRTEILTKERPLLVVGAGAAGVAAALRAFRKHNISTILVEKEDRPLLRQLDSIRFVCPTQYDFPVSHWTKRWYPLDDGSDLPLRWKAARSQEIAVRWAKEFTDTFDAPDAGHRRFKSAAGAVFEFIPGASVEQISHNSENHSSSVTVDRDRARMTRWAGMIIMATGFGKERCAYPDDAPSAGHTTIKERFRSYNFWDADQIEEEIYVDKINRQFHAKGREHCTFVISGGGDGGLQDVLRLSFAKPALEIFQNAFARSEPLAREVIAALHCAEDQAHRALQIAGSDADRDQIIFELDQKHRELVDDIWDAKERHEKALAHLPEDLGHSKKRDFERHGEWRCALSERMKEDFAAQVVDPEPYALHFIYGETFTPCYALNRFLVLLLLKLSPEWLHEHRGVRLASVEGTGEHTCNDNADACFARDHKVKLSTGEEISAQVIVLRHGFYNTKGKPIRMKQDVLPYFIPEFENEPMAAQ